MNLDILKNKNELNPGVLAALERQFSQFGCKRRKLVANLPYVVATPVIANLLISSVEFASFTVLVQWEIAERMTAEPGQKEHGALALLMQALANVTVVRRLAPTVFWPKPQVDSAIVHIVPDPAKRAKVGDPATFRVFLRDLYSHRRKNLRGALIGWPSGRREKSEVDRKLAELGIDGHVRAEMLGVEDHLRLSAAFSEKKETANER
jgi:16S rRNA (adenine1518-N6/adenine1519-N6)-dimethyltransferase